MDYEDRLVKIATAPNEVEALMWQEFLENEGIGVMVKPTGPGFADYSITICPHLVYVLEKDEARARELLESITAGYEDSTA